MGEPKSLVPIRALDRSKRNGAAVFILFTFLVANPKNTYIKFSHKGRSFAYKTKKYKGVREFCHELFNLSWSYGCLKAAMSPAAIAHSSTPITARATTVNH
ncbi:MAG: hypothetical protein LBU43_11120 [Candidatus Accumulibacter sp.]|nr:hypothetical protein [Accumulibacter sp.]